MSKFLALACAAVGVVGFSATRAEAAQPVNALPAVAHINQAVVIETGHRRHYNRGYHRGYYRHHHRHYYRHHRRFYR